MAWIESHQALSRHRKTLALAAELRTDRHKIIGHLHELWWWGLDNADIYGALGYPSDEVIAEASGWPLKHAAAWVAALKLVGYLDEMEDGLSLHDWYEYAGKINQRREENKERMRRKREEHTPPPRPTTNGARAQHVRSTNAARAPATVPDLTGPNRTTNVPSERMPESMSDEVADDPIDEVYEHFKARVQPKSRICPRKKIAARLKRFTVEEVREGIDHFAEDPWWMENNGGRGADWFFESDARAEQFLLMKPRSMPTVVPMNGVPRKPLDSPPDVPADSPFLKYREVS